MSEAQLESLYAGLVRIAALPTYELQALVQSLLGDKVGLPPDRSDALPVSARER
jgi:hypothetical protein